MRKTMKKLLVVLALLILNSCINSAGGKTFKINEAVLKEVYYDQPKAVKFSFKGHKYIMFYYEWDHRSVGGVIDDPDCELCKKNK